MLTAVGVALLASALLGASSRRLARVLPPPTTVRALSLAAVLMAVTTGFVLSVVCFNFLAQLPIVARAGRWSLSSLRSRELVSTSLGLAACLALVVVSVIVVRRAGRLLADLMAANRARRGLGNRGSKLLVVTDPRPQAYALPGFVAGRIVVSTGMLAALDGDERRVLLAHETAHLNHRHHLYVALSELAAAVNPFLAAVPAVVRTAVERWADEDAAAAVGDRHIAARAVAKAGLATATANRRLSAGFS
jgi:Zn-dependent protease with chaperone function